jgi:hypothetical protein
MVVPPPAVTPKLVFVVELFAEGAPLPGGCLPDVFNGPVKAVAAGIAELGRVAAISPAERDRTTDFASRFSERVSPASAGEAGATTFRTEFPDFDPRTMPALPRGWEDRSWRNDACPWFFNRGARLALGIEYLEPDRRTSPGAPRFNLCRVGIFSDGEPDLGGEEQQLVLATDDWAAMLEAIAGQPGLDARRLAAEAFTLAIQQLQARLGVRTGDVAGHFWSGREREVIGFFKTYVRAEQADARAREA